MSVDVVLEVEEAINIEVDGEVNSVVTLDVGVAPPVFLNIEEKQGSSIPVVDDASDINFVPYGDIEALNVQDAIEELDDEKRPQSMFLSGAKITGVDEGKLGQESYDNDYMYKCVVSGPAGVAIWKKTPLLNT